MKKITTCSKFHFLFLVNCFFFYSAFSQEVIWERLDLNDQPYKSICETNDAGFLIGGSKIINSLYKYWIIKTDSAGNKLWEKYYGGSGSDGLEVVTQTKDGGYLIGGSSNSSASGDKTENCIGSYDFWIIKTDSLGNLQWENTIGGTSQDKLISLKETEDERVILFGTSYSIASGDKSQNNFGASDFWLVQLNAFGAIQWERTIGGNADDYAAEVVECPDKGFLLGGTSFSGVSGVKNEASIGYSDYWIIKVDSLGNILWQNTIGGISGDALADLDISNDRGFILSGYSYSPISGDKTEGCIGQRDYWIVKVDSIGNVQWQNTLGGSWDDNSTGVVAAYDGGYVILGESNSPVSGDKSEDNMEYDRIYPWILKLDSAGNIVWQNTIQDTSFDISNTYYIETYTQEIIETRNHDFVNVEIIDWSPFWPLSSNIGNIRRITENFNAINGTVYLDANTSGVKDPGEMVFKNKKVTESNTGRFAFCLSDGSYSLGVLDTGSFSVSTVIPNFYTSAPLVHTASFTGLRQIDSLNNFVFQAINPVNDIWVSENGVSRLRPGFGGSYIINYGNSGTTTISPTIVLHLDSLLTFSYADSIPSLVTADSIVWNLHPLAPFETGTIRVVFGILASAPISSIVHSPIQIYPIINDTLPISNTHICIDPVSGSFDPNDILVSKEQLTNIELASQPYLEYTIRFQNTGNDTAFNIKITNPIDTNFLQISTIEFVNSSHPVTLKWLDWERNMEFKFTNILLPDSGTNQLLSNGFVKYRIKPKTALQVGDTIPNKAFIYFDFNLPVATNIAFTEIVQPNAIPARQSVNESLSLFPNPAKDEISILFNGLAKEEVPALVFDVFGRVVLSKNISSGDHKLLLANLPPGVYVLKVSSQTKKFIKS